MLNGHKMAIQKTGFLLFSWFLIYLSTSLFFDKTNYKFNLLFSVISTICYLLIPAFIKSKEEYKNYLNSIHFKFNQIAFIISFFYLFVLLLSLAIHYKLQLPSAENQYFTFIIYVPIIFMINLVLLGILPSFFRKKLLTFLISMSVLIFYFIDQPNSIIVAIILLGIFSCFLSQYTASIFPSILLQITFSTGLTYSILGALLISIMVILFAITKKSKGL